MSSVLLLHAEEIGKNLKHDLILEAQLGSDTKLRISEFASLWLLDVTTLTNISVILFIAFQHTWVEDHGGH